MKLSRRLRCGRGSRWCGGRARGNSRFTRDLLLREPTVITLEQRLVPRRETFGLGLEDLVALLGRQIAPLLLAGLGIVQVADAAGALAQGRVVLRPRRVETRAAAALARFLKLLDEDVQLGED